MTTKTIGKQAEREAKKLLEGNKNVKVVIKSEVSSYYEGSMKDSGPVDIVAVEQGTGYQVKTTAKPFYYFKNEEIDKILAWKERHGLNVKYAIKFRRGKGKPVYWFWIDVEEVLKNKKAILTDIDGETFVVTKEVKKR